MSRNYKLINDGRPNDTVGFWEILDDDMFLYYRDGKEELHIKLGQQYIDNNNEIWNTYCLTDNTYNYFDDEDGVVELNNVEVKYNVA